MSHKNDLIRERIHVGEARELARRDRAVGAAASAFIRARRARRRGQISRHDFQDCRARLDAACAAVSERYARGERPENYSYGGRGLPTYEEADALAVLDEMTDGDYAPFGLTDGVDYV